MVMKKSKKPALSVEQFTKILSHIEKQLEKDDELTKLLVCEDTSGWITTCPDIVCDLVTTVRMLLNDEDEWVSWWLWELDDDKSNAHVIVEEEGTKYQYTIKTTTDLYYLITEQLDKISMREEVSDEEVGDIIKEADKIINESDLYDMFMSQFNTKYTESDN